MTEQERAIAAPAETDVVRTAAGETVMGFPAVAWIEDVETAVGPVERVSFHWSTPGKSAVNVRRLFDEAALRAAYALGAARKTPAPADLREVVVGVIETETPYHLDHEQISDDVLSAIADAGYVVSRPFDPATAPSHTDLMVDPETLDAFMAANPLHGPTQAGDDLTAATRDVLTERRRQVEGEGHLPHDDDMIGWRVLARGAISYAICAVKHLIGRNSEAAQWWPWRDGWKPKDARRDMVRSVALGLAAIECMDRAMLSAAKKGKDNG